MKTKSSFRHHHRFLKKSSRSASSVLMARLASSSLALLLFVAQTASVASSVLAAEEQQELLLLPATTAEKSNRNRMLRADDSNSEPEVAGIVNGTDTGRPLSYQVRLAFADGSLQCGGSLISPGVVLTAAHCFYKKESLVWEPPNKVYLNQYKQDVGGKPVKIITLNDSEKNGDIFPHPNYNPVTYENDVALIMLRKKFFGLTTAQINEDGDVPLVTAKVYISGWGDTSLEGKDSNVLLGTVENVVSNKDCQTKYDFPKPPNNITEGMMCAEGDHGNGFCSGDSGGPLVVYDGDGTEPPQNQVVQVGIVSWSFGCAEEGFPDIYTRVSSYAKWIKTTACDNAGEMCPIGGPPPPTTTTPPPETTPYATASKSDKSSSKSGKGGKSSFKKQRP